MRMALVPKRSELWIWYRIFGEREVWMVDGELHKQVPFRPAGIRYAESVRLESR